MNKPSSMFIDIYSGEFSDFTQDNVGDTSMNAGLAIERARVRIPVVTVSKFGHFISLHDASVDSAV